jgi:LmbE family N-acetylglucosaminyl deacetylase
MISGSLKIMMRTPSTHKPHRRWRKRERLSVTLTVLTLLAVLSINAPGLLEAGYRSQVRAVARLSEFSLPGRGDRVLVISPHPDDETLCCAGTIQRALERGASVSVVWLTSGDGFTWDAIVLERQLIPNPIDMVKLGQRRMLEARAASATLGVPKANLYFLGYPDGGLRKMLEHPETPFRSRYTKLVRVPYSGVVTANALQTGTNLERDLERVIDQVKPTLVLAPSVSDAHPDHRATGELTLRILARRGDAATLRSWIIHGGLEWPLPKSWHTDLPLVPSPRGRNLPWQRVSLTPEQVQRKVRATRAYTSQVIALGRFMAAFSRTNELLSAQGTPER